MRGGGLRGMGFHESEDKYNGATLCSTIKAQLQKQ